MSHCLSNCMRQCLDSPAFIKMTRNLSNSIVYELKLNLAQDAEAAHMSQNFVSPASVQTLAEIRKSNQQNHLCHLALTWHSYCNGTGRSFLSHVGSCPRVFPGHRIAGGSMDRRVGV